MSHQMVDRAHPYCSVCEGVEGSSLPTDCPGVKLTQEQVAGIYNHTLDYRNDRWDSPGVFDWKPVSMPTGSSYGGTRHISTTVELPPDEDPPEVIHTSSTNFIPVPVPIPIPIPIPIPTGGSADIPDESEGEPTLDVDVHINR
ncbi:MAG: hypothetical protein JNM83_12525 [Myxococcales bacterium]|nr:hypothetical protein [Myxococcales bacterium]